MHLTPEQITDYEACPRYYDFKYNNDMVKLKLNKRQKMSNDFLEALKKVANFYLYKKQSFNDPTLTSLYNRWQRDWYEGDEAIDIVKMQNSVQQRSKTAFGTRAMDVINSLYDDFSEVAGDQIFWLNETYSVPVNDQKNTLSGKVDLVLRQKEDNCYHIFKWADSNESIHKHKYDLVSAEYAFRYRYDFREMNTRHYLWYLYGNQLGRQEISLDKKDFKLMCYNSKKLSEDKQCVPRYGYSTYCKGCKFVNKCLKWDFDEVENNVK